MNILSREGEKEQTVFRMINRWRPEYVSNLVAARRKPVVDLQTNKKHSVNKMKVCRLIKNELVLKPIFMIEN